MIQKISSSNNISCKGGIQKTTKGNEYYSLNTSRNFNLALLSPDALIAGFVNPRSIIFTMPIVALYAGVGAHVDGKRNAKAAEAADMVSEKGLVKARAENKNIKILDGEKYYYKSDTATKFYTNFGAAAGTALGLLTSIISLTSTGKMGKKLNNKNKAVIFSLPLICALSGAFEGWIHGKITDFISNKKTKKYMKSL